MNTKEAVKILEGAISKVRSLRASQSGSPEHIEFIQSTGLELARIFGPQSAVVMNFTIIDYQNVGTFLFRIYDYEYVLAERKREAYQNGLNLAEGILRSALEQVRKHGIDHILTLNTVEPRKVRIFVSHGSKTDALSKVERFIRALGLEPVIVQHEASEGLAVDDLVAKRMGECECALIVATADDEDIKGEKRPRGNVLHEIGLAQEKFNDKVIYLQEVGCKLPSNIGPKVWENFTQENMESAFEKISKELHAFGLI